VSDEEHEPELAVSQVLDVKRFVFLEGRIDQISQGASGFQDRAVACVLWQ